MIGYNYPALSYNCLSRMKNGLEGLIQHGADYPDVREQLKHVENELATRTHRLIGKFDGNEVVEYGRYRSVEECQKAAENIGTPIGTDFELQGRPFKTEIQPA
jgi:hypothetical protein